MQQGKDEICRYLGHHRSCGFHRPLVSMLLPTMIVSAFDDIFSSDEAFKGAAYLAKSVTDPKTAYSEEADETAFQMGMGTTKSMWDYYDTDDELARYRGERFNIAMSAYNVVQPPEDILECAY